MHRTTRWMLLLPLLVAGAAGAQSTAHPKVKLAMKAKAGQVIRYRSDVTLNAEPPGGGGTMEFEFKDTDKITIAAVSPTGEITRESETEASEVIVNGNKTQSPPDHEKRVSVYRPDGTLVSYTSSEGASDSTKLAVRLHAAMNAAYTDKEVGTGDKWTHDYTASAAGAHAGKAEFEVAGFEKMNGVDTIKLKMAYRESDANPPVTTHGTLWMELTSGDEVASDFQVENIPFGPSGHQVLASGKAHEERVEGGPLGPPLGPDGKPLPPKEKNIDDTVKGFDKMPGLFTLYKKKDLLRETVYMEIREDQLGKNYFLQATASTGTGSSVIAGDPINDILFRFEKSGDSDKLLMVTPNINFQAAPNSPVARAVKRGFPDGYLEQFQIEAKQPDRKSLLINISNLFRSDIAQVGQALSGGGLGALFGGASYMLDSSKTYVAQMKVFPDNLFVQTAYHFMRAGGARGGIASLLGGDSTTLADPRSVPLTVDFNLFELKNTGYRPRVADPRVGFFYTEFQDFSNDGRESEMVHYIYRWDLEKANPQLALSPPKKPIVFWIDNAVPVEYRSALSEGILLWNKAFEKVGLKDAIVVKQMPDNADWDHADMRYNVIRWSTTQSPPYGAIALMRVNPLTGEIVNASITVDAALARSGKFEHRRLVDPASAFKEDATPKAINPYRCELAEGAMEQSWYGDVALNLLSGPGEPVNEKEYIHQFLRSIAAHEFGHCLGLFHNFAASTEMSMADLKDPNKVKEQGTTASVMDYLPFNISALHEKDGQYYTPTIGAYDYWAIQYGYAPGAAKTPEDEEGWLKGIASQSNFPGHAYENDFLADQFDPYVSRFDLGSEPLDYWTRKLQVTRYLLFTLGKRMPKPGQSYWEFTKTFNGLLADYSRSAAMVSRYLGALRLNQNYRGDVAEKAPLQPIDGEKQRQALHLLNRYIFSENAFAFPQSYYTKFTNDPFPSMQGIANAPDFPVRDQMAGIEKAALSRLLSGPVLRRVVNNEYKMGKRGNELTLPELFGSVTHTVWSELDGGKNVSSLRRELQREDVDLLVSLALGEAGGAPDDARMIAWDQLRQLQGKLAAVPRQGLDTYTRVHLDETAMKVHRALNATQTIGGASGGGGAIRILLGDQQSKREPAPAPKN